MPPTQSPIEPGLPTPETETTELTPEQVSADAPLSFVPHGAPGEPTPMPRRFRTSRHGELEERDLVKLLDLIEDERARGRFRESIYISTFICIALAWVWFYGPRYLWHAPHLISPSEAIRQQEVTQLNLPRSRPQLPKAAPAPAPLNKQTIKQLQTMTKETHIPAPTPQPVAPPQQQTATNTVPPRPSPQPPLPSAPQPRTPVSSAVPDAPIPQPSAHPNFGATDNSPGTALGKALPGTRPGGSGGFRGDNSGGPLNDGAEVLSDMQGVDFGPYIRRILADIKRNWDPLLPEETRAPILKQGETYVRFKILPDGNIQAMALDGSTHDIAIDHSCWSAITSEGQFPPLPAQFHGQNLELRIHFLVNKGIGQ